MHGGFAFRPGVAGGGGAPVASGVVQIPHELQGLGLDPSHALSRAGYRLVLLGPANEVVDLSTGRLDKLPGPATKTAAREGERLCRTTA